MQKFPPEMFETTNFDRFHRGVSLRYVFQISLPNSEFRLWNRQCFRCMCRIYLGSMYELEL